MNFWIDHSEYFCLLDRAMEEKISRQQHTARDWCSRYPCCDHWRCSDAFWRAENLHILKSACLHEGEPGWLLLDVYKREEIARLDEKARKLMVIYIQHGD